MELHSQTAAKKIWDYLRAVLFMLKVKSVISKRKFLMDVNLFMNRSKYVGKSISNLLTHKHNPSHHHSIRDPSLLNEYEFSCHDTPNALFFNAKRGNNKRGYFTCLNTPVEEGGEEQEADLRTPLRLEYTSQELHDLTTPASPFDVRVSDFSSLEGEGSRGNGGVDLEAEDFIKRFYEQLKRQSEVGLLEYPQAEVEESV
ncbi:Avr9/Cf-9 rapidly elicited protein [Rhynchospora pubera]|uniref:Avr9/Cf-9 rapidly elicited protein n=1 Tax=Rhynchospora pubera TaxID=906938 RepID=A0AAV8DZ60_9POAL|nr:Avr9/Cf-9 rapidly elicited protein [Rhynchospora pubera]